MTYDRGGALDTLVGVAAGWECRKEVATDHSGTIGHTGHHVRQVEQHAAQVSRTTWGRDRRGRVAAAEDGLTIYW